MLDISFSELLLCFIVALVVLGPERLPGIARGVGRWTGKARSYVRNLTAELERESHIAEFKQQVTDAKRILEDESKSMQQSLEKTASAVENESRAMAAEVKQVADAAAAPAEPSSSTTESAGTPPVAPALMPDAAAPAEATRPHV